MFDRFRADLRRYLEHATTRRDQVVEVALNPAVWAVAIYRLGAWVYSRPRPIIGAPLRGGYLLLYKSVEIVSGVHLPPSCEIGPGLYIGHAGCVHVSPQAVIGSGCTLSQGVTLGASAGGRQGVPVLEDGVYVGAGAKVIGAVRVGQGSSVSANSLVMSDVPEGATVMGVPARVVFRPPQATAASGGNSAGARAEGDAAAVGKEGRAA
jgi:serine O-acetyltransferase